MVRHDGRILDLGRRVERLLYFGGILIVVCLAQMYMSTVALYMGSQNAAGYEVLLSEIGESLQKLKDLHGESNDAQTVAPDTGRMAAVARTRAKLGLPPVKRKKIEEKETYQSAVRELVKDAAIKTGVSYTELYDKVDFSIAPEELMAKLKDSAKTLREKPVVVWGIETPVVLPFQYGAAEFHVPASVIANFGMVVLAPILLVWFGSLRLTRRRELFGLRQADSYMDAFPHILNILPLSRVTLFGGWEVARKNRKAIGVQDGGNKILSAIGRTLVILLFSFPLLGAFFYSGLELIELKRDVGLYEFWFVFFPSGWLLSQTIELIAQEWLMLWGKTFNA